MSTSSSDQMTLALHTDYLFVPVTMTLEQTCLCVVQGALAGQLRPEERHDGWMLNTQSLVLPLPLGLALELDSLHGSLDSSVCVRVCMCACLNR